MNSCIDVDGVTAVVVRSMDSDVHSFIGDNNFCGKGWLAVLYVDFPICCTAQSFFHPRHVMALSVIWCDAVGAWDGFRYIGTLTLPTPPPAAPLDKILSDVIDVSESASLPVM